MGLGLGGQVIHIEAARQGHAKIGLIQRIARLGPHQARQIAHGPRFGLFACGIIEHDVVRVHQVHTQEPRLFLTARGRCKFVDQHGGIAGDVTVGAVAGPCQADFLAVEIIVREAERLHGVGGVVIEALEALVAGGQLGQMPLALIGAVIARTSHHIADGVDLGIEHSTLFGIGKDTGFLRVLAGIDDGARGRAGRGLDVIVAQFHRAFQQGTVAGQMLQQALRIGLQAELLIGADEQDVERLVAGR